MNKADGQLESQDKERSCLRGWGTQVDGVPDKKEQPGLREAEGGSRWILGLLTG